MTTTLSPFQFRGFSEESQEKLLGVLRELVTHPGNHADLAEQAGCCVHAELVGTSLFCSSVRRN